MADGRPVRKKRKREVFPTDPKGEEPNFGSAKTWGRKQLILLGVQFVPNAKKRLDLNTVLNINEENWPPAIRERNHVPSHSLMIGVAECKRQLAAVDMEQHKAGHIDDYAMSELAPFFAESFATLSALMTYQGSKEKKKDPASSEVTASLLRSSAAGQNSPRTLSLTGLSANRAKEDHDTEIPDQPTTPDNPTSPSDPKFTGGTSSTLQSQAEDNTKLLLNEILGESMRALKREFGYINWQQSGHSVHLFKRYIL